MATRNITLSLPDDLIRRAKVLAAQRDTSVSALVSEALAQMVGGSPDYDDAWNDEVRLMSEGIDLVVGDVTWTRDELHTR